MAVVTVDKEYCDKQN